MKNFTKKFLMLGCYALLSTIVLLANSAAQAASSLPAFGCEVRYHRVPRQGESGMDGFYEAFLIGESRSGKSIATLTAKLALLDLPFHAELDRRKKKFTMNVSESASSKKKLLRSTFEAPGGVLDPWVQADVPLNPQQIAQLQSRLKSPAGAPVKIEKASISCGHGLPDGD